MDRYKREYLNDVSCYCVSKSHFSQRDTVKLFIGSDDNHHQLAERCVISTDLSCQYIFLATSETISL